MIEFGHATHAGLCREHNEDTYWADAGSGLFMVVDGMGGYRRGEVAAAIARDTLVAAARTGRNFQTSILEAGAAIASRGAESTGPAPMGAAVALLQLGAAHFYTLRVGDSRVQLWQDGRITCIDADAPLASSALPRRADNPNPASVPRRPSQATQALGVTPSGQLRITVAHGASDGGTQFLLSSAGLSTALDPASIPRVLARTDLTAQECAEHLLLAALDAGGPDNVTVLLVRIA
jgi:protein phosphatase